MNELEILSHIVELLELLDDDARERTLDWLFDKYPGACDCGEHHELDVKIGPIKVEATDHDPECARDDEYSFGPMVIRGADARRIIEEMNRPRSSEEIASHQAFLEECTALVRPFMRQVLA